MAVGYRSSSASGTADTQSTSCVVPVPSGAAAGDIALLAIEQWESFGATNTPPAGFTLAATVENSTVRMQVYWKRLSGADTGNYTITWTGNIWNMGHCILITGAAASGDPIEATNTASSASGTGIPSTTVTTVTQAFLAHFAANDNSGSATPPTGFTEVQDGQYIHTNYRIPGTTGTQTASGGTISTSGIHVAALIAVKPDATGSQTADASLTGTAGVTAAGTSTKPAAATLPVTATRSVAGTSTKPVAASLDGTAAVSASGTATKPAAASLTATAAITADATVGLAPKLADAALTVTAALSATAATTKPAAASRTVTAALTASAIVTDTATATVTTTAGITAAGAVTKPAAATLTVTAGTTATLESSADVDFVCQDFAGTATTVAYSGTSTLVAHAGSASLDAYGGTVSTVSHGGTASICGR
ncbi:hypothetical protein [Amycolatopsis thermoflava]|uniref:hypothetical protein n=1 Tax=Amycolatopsis thermoflava TaxID=84480 RepID=UPI0012FB8FA7|nr:hypothetical protein [Amycolatopsis thermoflava]